jgi:hypothetical protein
MAKRLNEHQRAWLKPAGACTPAADPARLERAASLSNPAGRPYRVGGLGRVQEISGRRGFWRAGEYCLLGGQTGCEAGESLHWRGGKNPGSGTEA